MAIAIKAIIGEKVLGKEEDGQGGEIDVETLCGEGKIIGLYCSAHWCPPCRGFTPILVEFYKNVHESKNVEIIFVSCDQDRRSFEEYYKTMPWLTMPFDDKYKGRDDVMTHFDVEGIPALIFIDGATGEELTQNGREEVTKDVSGASFPSWNKQQSC